MSAIEDLIDREISRRSEVGRALADNVDLSAAVLDAAKRDDYMAFMLELDKLDVSLDFITSCEMFERLKEKA